jgi:hypothetical protein
MNPRGVDVAIHVQGQKSLQHNLPGSRLVATVTSVLATDAAQVLCLLICLG